MLKKMMSIVAIVVLVLALAPTAQAAWSAGSTLVQPTGADAIVSWSNRPASNAIDGSGFTAGEILTLETGDPVPETWPNNGAIYLQEWQANMVDTGHGAPFGADWIEFDLGQDYTIQGVHVWNAQDDSTRGIKAVDVKVATGATAPADWDLIDVTKSFVDDTEFAQATSPSAGEDYEFDTPVAARWVFFDISSTWGHDIVGISEVRMVFDPDPSVPGDVDGDGNVDLADMGIFEAQFGMSGLSLPPGENSPDLDADGDVDLDDLVFIRDNFGFVTPAAPAAATPEPATMTVLAIGGLAVLRRRRRKA